MCRPSVLRHGLGRHIWALRPSPDDYKSLLMGLFILQVSYIVELVLVKCSILLFYWRIFRVSSIRYPIYILFVIVTLWGLATVSDRAASVHNGPTYFSILLTRTSF